MRLNAIACMLAAHSSEICTEMTRAEAPDGFITSQMERHNESVMKVLNWNIASFTTEDIGSTEKTFRRPRGSTFHEITESPNEYICVQCSATTSSPSELHFCFTCIDKFSQEPEFCSTCLKKLHFGHSYCSLSKAPKELRRRMNAESVNNLKMVDSLVLSKLVAKFKTHMTRYREEFRSQIVQGREEEMYLSTSDIQTELSQLRALRSQTEDEMRKLRAACREFDKFINEKFPCD